MNSSRARLSQIQQLVDSFKVMWPIQERAINALCDRVVVSRYKKRRKVLSAGEECNHFNFVVDGCLKMFNMDDKGKAHNLHFAVECQWITDYASFYNNSPTSLAIETLENTTLLRIRKQDLFFLYDNFPEFDRNFRIIIENAFIEQQQRVLQNIGSSAEERYLNFIDKYPNLIQRISNVQIASYLGVTPEFLSVIRKKITTI